MGTNIKPDFRDLYAREMQIVHLINRIESCGLRFDFKKAMRKNLKIRDKMNKVLATLDDVNPNAPKQVIDHLLLLGVREKDLTLKGKLSSKHEVLLRVLNSTEKPRVKEFIENLFEYRGLKKISSTYLGPLSKRARQNDGIICCTINPTDARTGRPASKDPNLFNIPNVVVKTSGQRNPVRECFTVRDGYANYYFDFAAMEVGIFGLMAGDTRIIEAYLSGVDIHAFMAQQVYKQYDENPKYYRDSVKAVTFGKVYGSGIKGMAIMNGISIAEAMEWSERYENEFTTIHEFQKECKDTLKKQGFVKDDFGRRYSIPVGQAYKAVNALVQGSCAQIFKIALLKVQEYLDNLPKKKYYQSHILLTVYDEIQMESKVWRYLKKEHEFVREVIRRMVDIPQLNKRGFKLRVDVKKSTTNWADKQKLEV